jgi:hypothetical protein
MNRRQALIEDHKEMLQIRLKQLRFNFPKRNLRGYDRDMVRWMVEQAKMHKHMIEQLSELPDMPYELCGSW